MKISKNLLKFICLLICCILLAVQIVYIVRLNDYSTNKNTIAVANTGESAMQNNGAQAPAEQTAEAPTELPAETPAPKERVIILDAGHGKSSGSMTSEEKLASGWVQNSSGSWGEWRHWKSGTMWQDCLGSGCNGRAPSGGGCWYPIGNGDRSIEPEINLNNALAAKNYLEQMNYTVRMTRSSNDENPSLSQRLKNCYPDMNIEAEPDAIAYVCIHSNAGGGTGSAYLSLSSGYDHAYSTANYEEEGNALGKIINQRIVAETDLNAFADGSYPGQPDLILFHKSPIPVAYLEIGFFDDSRDLSILRSESDQIGRAIAEGIDDYVTGKGL